MNCAQQFNKRMEQGLRNPHKARLSADIGP